MSLLDFENHGSYYFSLSAIVFMVLFIMVNFGSRVGRDKRSITETVLFRTSILALISCITELSAMGTNHNVDAPRFLRFLLYSGNISLMMICAASFETYTFLYIYPLNPQRKDKKYRMLSVGAILFFHLILFLNYFYGFIFYYDAKGDLVFGKLNMVMAYGAPVLYLFIGLIAVLRNWKKLNGRERIALLSTHFLVIAGGVVQGFLHDKVLLVSFCIAVGLYIINFFLEAPDYHLLVETNQRLMDAERRANAANQAKSDFLSSMSHEIRTPMNAVLGMNEMARITLADDTITEEVRKERLWEYARTIQNSGEALLSLINDILDVSKIESGKLELVDNPYHMQQLLSELIETFTYTAETRGLMFTSHVDQTLPGYVEGDQLRIRQIITNILNNALKYTKKGSVFLGVGGHVKGDMVYYDITVRDTGIGIKPENLDSIFGSFDRIDNQETHFIEGSGLGLSIVKRLLDIMGGTVSVESEYGRGSEFSVQIPQKVLSPEKLGDYDAVAVEARESKVKEQAKDFGEKQILVVDDNATNISVAQRFLERMHVKVDTALSGRDALGKIAAKAYDVILLDHMMPEMSGDQVLRQVKADPQTYARNRETPIIAMTANALSGQKEIYINEYGFTDYLSKPFRYSELEEMVGKYVTGKEKAVTDQAPTAAQSPAAVQSPTAAQSPTATQEEEMREVVEQHQQLQSEEINAGDPELEAAMKDLSYIDLKAGIAVCMDAEIYTEVAQTYLSEMDTHLEELQKYSEAGDWKNYCVIAHALKSSSITIGASNFGLLSRRMEERSNALYTAGEDPESLKFIQDNYETYLKAYRDVCEALKIMLESGVIALA